MKSILIFLFLALPLLSFSQAPQGFNYQAIVRDASGNVRANEGVQFQFRIQDLAGSAVYTENHTVVTNKYGLADGIIIGKGSTIDDFSSIDWGNGTYYINVKVDGVDLGTSQLLSVPYALYALNAGSGSGGTDGVGIQSTVDNGDGTFTLNYTDGTSFTTIDFSGTAGQDGLPGKSAYQSWLDAGNTGTELEFVNSLSGTDGTDGVDGADGVDGKSAYQIWLDQGNTGNELDYISALQGPKGPKGDQGVKGDQGDQGNDGNGGFLSGSSDPVSTDGEDGDFYINTATNKIFGPKKAGSTPSGWPVGISLKGDTGSAGADGSAGAKGDKGDKGDTGATGATGKSAYEDWKDLGNTGTEADFIASLKGAKGDTGDTGAALSLIHI